MQYTGNSIQRSFRSMLFVYSWATTLQKLL